MWSSFVFITVSITNAINVFLQGFFVIMFSDLEVDYINPIDLCNKLNPYIVPEAALQAVASLLLLLTGHLWSFAMCLPLLAFNIYHIYTNQYLLDATEIFKTLSKHKRTAFIKLIYHVVIFFFFLFNMIVSLIELAEGK